MYPINDVYNNFGFLCQILVDEFPCRTANWPKIIDQQACIINTPSNFCNDLIHLAGIAPFMQEEKL